MLGKEEYLLLSEENTLRIEDPWQKSGEKDKAAPEEWMTLANAI